MLSSCLFFEKLTPLGLSVRLSCPNKAVFQVTLYLRVARGEWLVKWSFKALNPCSHCHYVHLLGWPSLKLGLPVVVRDGSGAF
jgi:hypothetical protein